MVNTCCICTYNSICLWFSGRFDRATITKTYLYHKIVRFYLDTITLHVENMYTKLNRIRGIRSERTNGEITMDSVSLRNCPSDDLLLRPTRIIMKIISYSSCTPSPIMNSTAELNVTTNCISFDVSQNNYEILLSMWNTYKYLFETKDNRIQNNLEGIVHAHKYQYKHTVTVDFIFFFRI